MTRGYCESCDRLVAIVPSGPRTVARGIPSALSGQLAWRPLPHSLGDTGGELCPGGGIEIKDRG